MRRVLLGVWLGLCGAVSALAGPLPDKTLMDEAFQAAQWAHLSSAGAALRQTAARRAAGDDALARLLQDRQILLDQIDRAERELATIGGTEAGETLARSTELGGQINAARTALDLLDRQLAEEFPDYRNLAQPSGLTIAQVQSRLGPDEGLVFLYSGDRDTYIWAITQQASLWHRVGLSRSEIEESVTGIRQTLHQANTLRGAEALDDDAGTGSGDGPPFASVEAMLLYTELLRSFEPLLADVTHLYSVVEGPLSGLPLSLLITDWNPRMEPFTRPEQFRDANWLFQRYALTTLPSVDSLALVVDNPRTPGTGFIGFGDPVFGGRVQAPSDGEYFNDGRVDLNSLRALAPLPGTRRELLQLARLFGSETMAVHLGADATETAVRAAGLESAGVIAFATHGLLSGELRGLAEPALAFTPPEAIQVEDDGLLTASEISELSLNADWVVLSACNTAGSDGTPDAEGLSGLARSFLFAGARTLMVSHWPVRDDAAQQLTTSTFQAMRSGQARRKAEALQSAMQQMLMRDDGTGLHHPAAWAPFVLVGHGG